MSVNYVSASIGAWTIRVNNTEAKVQRFGNDEIHSTNVILFPNGYKVGRIWSNGHIQTTDKIPNLVKVKASSLARNLCESSNVSVE